MVHEPQYLLFLQFFQSIQGPRWFYYFPLPLPLFSNSVPGTTFTRCTFNVSTHLCPGLPLSLLPQSVVYIQGRGFQVQTFPKAKKKKILKYYYKIVSIHCLIVKYTEIRVYKYNKLMTIILLSILLQFCSLWYAIYIYLYI